MALQNLGSEASGQAFVGGKVQEDEGIEELTPLTKYVRVLAPLTKYVRVLAPLTKYVLVLAPLTKYSRVPGRKVRSLI